MPVCVYEKVNMLLFKYLSGILHLKLLFILKGENLRFVGGAAASGKVAGNSEGVPGMQHAVKHAVGLISKNTLDKIVATLLAT